MMLILTILLVNDLKGEYIGFTVPLLISVVLLHHLCYFLYVCLFLVGGRGELDLFIYLFLNGGAKD